MSAPLKSSDRTLRLSAALALAVAVVFVGAIGWMRWSAVAGDPFRDCRQGAVGGGAIGGPFTLIDENGRTVTDAEVIAGPTLIYFGYSYCPDVCPMDLDRNVTAVDILAEKGIEVKPVFITVDPERDTPDEIRIYTDALHPRLLGLTGSADQVTAAERAFRVFASRRESESGGDYTYDHSTHSYLMLPGRGFVEFFGREVSAEELATRTACFVRQAG